MYAPSLYTYIKCVYTCSSLELITFPKSRYQPFTTRPFKNVFRRLYLICDLQVCNVANVKAIYSLQNVCIYNRVSYSHKHSLSSKGKENVACVRIFSYVLFLFVIVKLRAANLLYTYICVLFHMTLALLKSPGISQLAACASFIFQRVFIFLNSLNFTCRIIYISYLLEK